MTICASGTSYFDKSKIESYICQIYIPRALADAFRNSLKYFPVVLITGPRQSGKTTFLLHETGKRADYVTFDDPVERSFAIEDPNGFLDRFMKEHVILDEIQYVPELLSYLKMRVDRDRKRNGRWILAGSQQFQLMKNVGESLAGRIAILELLPFGSLELEKKSVPKLETFVWNGGYPDPALAPAKRELWIRSYIQTYIERDVRQLQNVKDLRTFELFLSLIAANHGNLFNTAALSREVGISLPTIKSWAEILEASYLVFFLPPYFKNYGKRLTKSAKGYLFDSALICAMTRQPDAMSALSGAMGGALFEGLIVSEAVKVFTMLGKRPDIFFWRSHDGLEVDLIIQIGQKLVPVEIKLTATPSPKHLEPLNRFRSLVGPDSDEKGLRVCRTTKSTPMAGNNLAIPWNAFPGWLEERLK